jgi:hypothetical protein
LLRPAQKEQWGAPPAAGSCLSRTSTFLRGFLESKVTIPRGLEAAKVTLSIWDKLFSRPHHYERERKVLEYVCHRVGEGAHLGEVLQEEYVRRNASHTEIEEMLGDPRLIETAHEKMREDFYSGRLNPLGRF